MNDIKFGLFQAKYSAGYDLQVIKPIFEQYVRNMPEIWSRKYGYQDMLAMLSIAIMYEGDDELWEILVGLVEESKIGDWLIYYLISNRNNNVQYDNYELKVKRQYQFLKEFIEGNPKDLSAMKTYLENIWYESHRDLDGAIYMNIKSDYTVDIDATYAEH